VNIEGVLKITIETILSY